MQEQYIW